MVAYRDGERSLTFGSRASVRAPKFSACPSSAALPHLRPPPHPIQRAGLEPVGIDVAAFGMIRALAGAGASVPAQEAVLFCNVGDVANLAVARGRACLFTRVSHSGLEALAGRLAAARVRT